MPNGLDIDLGSFKSLPAKEQNTILYDNLQQVKKLMGAYKFQQKVQWTLIGLISAGVVFLIQIKLQGG